MTVFPYSWSTAGVSASGTLLSSELALCSILRLLYAVCGASFCRKEECRCHFDPRKNPSLLQTHGHHVAGQGHGTRMSPEYANRYTCYHSLTFAEGLPITMIMGRIKTCVRSVLCVISVAPVRYEATTGVPCRHMMNWQG